VRQIIFTLRFSIFWLSQTVPKNRQNTFIIAKVIEGMTNAEQHQAAADLEPTWCLHNRNKASAVIFQLNETEK